MKESTKGLFKVMLIIHVKNSLNPIYIRPGYTYDFILSPDDNRRYLNAVHRNENDLGSGNENVEDGDLGDVGVGVGVNQRVIVNGNVCMHHLVKALPSMPAKCQRGLDYVIRGGVGVTYGALADGDCVNGRF